MNKTNLKPPFAWIGGKSKLVNDILEIIPSHTHYIEVCRFTSITLCKAKK